MPSWLQLYIEVTFHAELCWKGRLLVVENKGLAYLCFNVSGSGGFGIALDRAARTFMKNHPLLIKAVSASAKALKNGRENGTLNQKILCKNFFPIYIIKNVFKNTQPTKSFCSFFCQISRFLIKWILAWHLNSKTN